MAACAYLMEVSLQTQCDVDGARTEMPIVSRVAPREEGAILYVNLTSTRPQHAINKLTMFSKIVLNMILFILGVE